MPNIDQNGSVLDLDETVLVHHFVYVDSHLCYDRFLQSVVSHVSALDRLDSKNSHNYFYTYCHMHVRR